MGKKRIKITDQKMKDKKVKVQSGKDEQLDKEQLKAVAEEEGKEAHTEDKKQKNRKKSKSFKADEYKEKIDELNDKYLRLFSEFDNYRRRTSREKLELTKTASEELMIDLLPVLDDFERAIKSNEESNDCDVVKEGMQLIFNKFNGGRVNKVLSAIEATGKDFDTDFHEAITYIQAPSEALKEKIVDELEKGYLLNDKVIRYTKVVIGQ